MRFSVSSRQDFDAHTVIRAVCQTQLGLNGRQELTQLGRDSSIGHQKAPRGRINGARPNLPGQHGGQQWSYALHLLLRLPDGRGKP